MRDYSTILTELVKYRAAIIKELKDVNNAINVIQPLLTDSQKSIIPNDATSQIGDYSHMTLQWAILWHLAEFTDKPMHTTKIADTILLGGYETVTKDFNQAVSSYICNMRKNGEITGNKSDGYIITDKGRKIWTAIKNSEKFIRRLGMKS